MTRAFFIEQEPKFWAEKMKFIPPSLKNIKIDKPEFKYSTSRIRIGVKDNGFYSLNFDESKRILILGKSSSGKTYLLHTIIDRFAKSGGCVFILDVKGEYITLSVPLQKKFHKFLTLEESPSSLEVKSFYPKLLKASGYIPCKNREEYIDIDVCKIQADDLIPFLGRISNNERILLINCFDKKPKDAVELLKLIEESGERDATIKNLYVKVTSLILNNVLGESMPNIEDLLKEGQINILNMKGFDTLDYNTMPAEFLSLILKKIYSIKQSGSKRGLKVMIVIDELSTWIENESIMSIIMTLLTKGRLFEMSELFSMQFKGQKIPESLDNIFSQISHCFLPYNIDFTELIEIYKRLMPTEYDYPINFKMKVSELYNSLNKKNIKTGARDWMSIEVENQDTKIFSPLAPLSHHTLEGEDSKEVVEDYFKNLITQ